ncbi:MAG: hypothetical protein K2K77_01195 [Duncaniella sp.]|nr:hypothetical protein [Duncaniella sp.]
MTEPVSLAADEDVRVTEPFVTRSGDYLNVIMRWWLRRYGWMIWLPVVGVAAAGVILHDERIAIVALLLILIIMPMVMLFLYIFYMLAPDERVVVLRKRVVIAEGRYIRLEYLPELREETDDDDAATSGRVDFPQPEDETVMWDEVSQVTSTPRYMVYVLHGKPRQIILIPHSAIKY